MRWYEKRAVGQGMPRTQPRSCREGERYFSQGVTQQYLREMRDTTPRPDNSQD